MQSKKEEFLIELDACDAEKSRPRSFDLYEEYSRRSIAETVGMRRESFGKADVEAKKELATEVEDEVEGFRVWLEETKSLRPDSAHYYSVSLKSLLLGLPVGVQVACLFDKILNMQIRE